MLFNSELNEVFPVIEVQHFSKQGLDHVPVHVTCKS